jgi:hypothetical protein
MTSMSRTFSIWTSRATSREGIEMIKAHPEDHTHTPQTPHNAPEQRSAGFAQGEADPVQYPGDLEIGRFSTGEDESEPIERCTFAEGQATEPQAIDPNEGFAERS